jgi:hypothetical protein
VASVSAASPNSTSPAANGQASSSAAMASTITMTAMTSITILIQWKLRSHQESFRPSWPMASLIFLAAVPAAVW